MLEGLESDLLRARRALEKSNTPYALIGGIAVGLWGVPRASGDIDFLPKFRDTDHLAAFLKAARAEGLSTRAAIPEDLERRGSVRLFGPAGYPVDLILHAHGDSPPAKEAARMVKRARTVNIAGARVRIVRPEDLVVLKAAAGRPQDLADIAALCGSRRLATRRLFAASRPFGVEDRVRERIARASTRRSARNR